MKKKAMPPFRLAAGQSGRLMFHFALPEGATTPMLRGALMVHGESVAMENTAANVLTIPSLPAGVYLSEVRADGVCVLYGHVEVLPSPLSGDAGLATYRIDVDNTTDVLVVNVTLSDDAAMCAQAVTKATQAAELAGGSEVAAALSATAAAASQSKAESAAGAAMDSAAAANARAAEAAAAVAAADARMVAAQDAAAAAEDERETAAAEAAAAGASAEAAAGAAKDAAARAADAATSSQVAAGAASDALEARTAAGRAAESADARMVAAQDAAADAAAAREGADAAATQAQAGAAGAAASASAAAESASAAAESATAAAESVDMAEMSLPFDYMRFAHVTSFKELAQQAPDLIETEVWRYPLNSLVKAGEASMDTYFKRLRRVCLYSEADSVWSSISDPDYRIVPFFNNSQLEEVRVVYPKAKSISYMTPWGSNSVERLYVYAPQTTNFTIYAVAGFYPRWVWLYVASENIDNWILQSGVRTIAYIGPVAKKINQSCLKNLTEVLCGFPVATLLNFQKAQLNKESVLRIVNSLMPYNPATMTEMPQLTLGISSAVNGDEEVNEALLLAQTAVEDGGKGWSVAVNGVTITAGGAAATLGLRRPVYARRWADAEGDYVDADGTRWSVRWGNTVLENWVANEQLGYEEFATIEDALEGWGLEAYVPAERGQTME